MNSRGPRRSAREIGQGLAAAVAIAALVLGVPVALSILVGWPLPRSVPNFEEIRAGLQRPLSDTFLLKAIAIVCWVAWLQVAACAVVEIGAAIKGARAPRVPLAGPVQRLVCHLVLTAFVLAGNLGTGRAATASPPGRPPLEATAPLTSQAIVSLHTQRPAPAAAMAEHPRPEADGSRKAYVVKAAHGRHRDTLWGIAEAHLGDPMRWPDIVELNQGQAQPDGGSLTDAGRIEPGWILLMPDDAVNVTTLAEARSSPSRAVPGNQVEVEEGDTLWTISENRLEIDFGREPTVAEIDPYWREAIDANEDRYVEPGNPNLILPGQVLVFPSTGHVPPATPPASAEPASSPESAEPPGPEPAERNEPAEAPNTSTTIVTPPESEAPPLPGEVPPPPPAAPAPSSADDADREAESDVAVQVAVAVGGLSSIALAVGLKRLLDRRRRRFANEHDGQLPRRTPIEHRDLHRAVVAQADEERIDDLQGVLGSLAASLAATSSSRRPRMVRHSADSVELLLDQPDPNPPAGWVSTGDGAVWTLTEPPDPDDPYDGPLRPAPLVVTIGQPEDDAQLYLDLEADGLLALTGDPDVATNLARSIVTELALSPLAETLRVIGVGDVVDPDARVLEHLTVVDCWEGIAEDLVAWATQSHEALAEEGWPNAFVARGHEPDHDALVPVAVVADRPPPIELVDSLRASLPSTVAVVVVGAFDGAVATVRCEVDTLNFDMLDLACEPQEVVADELAEMCRLLVATDSLEEQELMDELRAEHAAASPNGSEPVAESGHVADRETVTPDPNGPPGHEVLVRLLGDITVEGGKPLKPKATAVVAYLALHRTVTTGRLEEACWFGSDGTSHRKRLRDVMTEVRDALGSQHFPANRSGSYVAGPRVRTDLDWFEWHVQRAADLDPAGAIGHYRAALDLVSGRPFSYPNAARASYGWVDFEHHSTTWEYRVATVAQACTELCLDGGQPGEAITMLRRIVQAIPLNEAVVEALMRTHIANDDRAGSERVYQEHATALQQAKLGDPDDSIEQLRFDLRAR